MYQSYLSPLFWRIHATVPLPYIPLLPSSSGTLHPQDRNRRIPQYGLWRICSKSFHKADSVDGIRFHCLRLVSKPDIAPANEVKREAKHYCQSYYEIAL